jgi:serine/threonine protein kinase/Tfp pilus assembly protein PilF
MTDQFERDAAELLGRGEITGRELRRETEPIPESLGPFRIVRLLGRGGAGDVYLARDTQAERDVALKILHRLAVSNLERFVREARVAALLSHPNLVPIHDAGRIEQWHYISMKYIEGGSIAGLRLTAEEAAEKMRRVALAAHYAHEQGIVHRDITPGNVLVDRGGEPYLADFGLAKRSEASDGTLSATGAIIGTPAYMAPEQARGEVHTLDARTDVYGLGATLYELAAGRPPFPDSSIYTAVRRVVDEDPPPPDVPRPLRLVIAKAMDKEPGSRYPSAKELAEDLKRFVEGKPVKARPPSFARRLKRRIARHRGVFLTAGLGFLAAALGTGLLLYQSHRVRTSEQEEHRKREESLWELSRLWSHVLLARQGFYQAQQDPGRTRRRIEEAIGGITEFLARHPGHPQGLFARAWGRLFLDEHELAKEDLGRVIAREPRFAPAWALLGRVLVEQYRQTYGTRISEEERRRRYEPLLVRAEEAFRRGWSGEAWGLGPMSPDEVPQTLARAASLHYVEKKNSEAMKLLEEAVAREPSEEYWNAMGALTADPRRAIECQTEALRIMPWFARAHLDRGNAHQKLGELDPAAENYTAALRINPKLRPAYVNRSVVRSAQGRWREAEADCTAALELEPGHVTALANRAYARLLGRNLRGAIEDCELALQADPQNVQALINRAGARAGLGQWKEVVEDCDRALAAEPGQAEAWVNRGVAKLNLADLEGAVADSTRAIELKEGLAQPYINRALAHELLARRSGQPEQERLRQAEEDFLRALRLPGGHRILAQQGLDRVRARRRDY